MATRTLTVGEVYAMAAQATRCPPCPATPEEVAATVRELSPEGRALVCYLACALAAFEGASLQGAPVRALPATCAVVTAAQLLFEAGSGGEEGVAV